MSDGSAGRPGFYGKLPSRGDFVRAGLSRGLASGWDLWMRSVLPPARRSLGSRWSAAWRVTPAWRFTAAAGLCGETPVTGLWLPSWDRVGREFSLLIAVEFSAGIEAFAALEAMAGDAVRSGLDPDDLLARLGGAPRPQPASACVVGTCWRTGPHHEPDHPNHDGLGRMFSIPAMPDPIRFVDMLG